MAEFLDTKVLLSNFYDQDSVTVAYFLSVAGQIYEEDAFKAGVKEVSPRSDPEAHNARGKSHDE